MEASAKNSGKSVKARSSKTSVVKECTRYSEKDDLTSAIVVVAGSSLFVGKEILSLFSPVFKEMFANAEVGELYELPVVKIDDESVDDIILLLDLIYPDSEISINDSNLNTTIRLSQKYKTKALRQKCIKFVKMQPVPKLMYRQLADTYELEELKVHLTYDYLAQKVSEASIDSELKTGLELQLATNVYRSKLTILKKAISEFCNKSKSWYISLSYRRYDPLRCDSCKTNKKLRDADESSADCFLMSKYSLESLKDALNTCK